MGTFLRFSEHSVRPARVCAALATALATMALLVLPACEGDGSANPVPVDGSADADAAKDALQDATPDGEAISDAATDHDDADDGDAEAGDP